MSERRPHPTTGRARPPRAAARPRRALELLAAGLAAGLAACGSRTRRSCPMSIMPEGSSPGTAAPLRHGRCRSPATGAACSAPPSKAGRPRSRATRATPPASAPPTSSPQAAVMSALRPRPLAGGARTATTSRPGSAFVGALLPQIAGARGRRRRRPAHADRPRSPRRRSLRQMQALADRFPQARWHALRAGRRRQRARAVRGWPSAGRSRPCRDLAAPSVMLALDADPLGAGPEQIRNARAASPSGAQCGGTAAAMSCASTRSSR